MILRGSCCGAFTALCMDPGIFMCYLYEGTMLIDHGFQVLARTDGCPASAGSIFGLVLDSSSKDVTRFFLRRPGLLCFCGARCRGVNALPTGTGKTAQIPFF